MYTTDVIYFTGSANVTSVKNDFHKLHIHHSSVFTNNNSQMLVYGMLFTQLHDFINRYFIFLKNFYDIHIFREFCENLNKISSKLLLVLPEIFWKLFKSIIIFMIYLKIFSKISSNFQNFLNIIWGLYIL